MHLAPIIGAQVHFAPAGREVEEVTAAEDVKPPGADFEDGWEALSCITDNNITHDVSGGTEIRCHNPVTGRFEKKATRGRTVTLVIEMTVQEITQFMMQLAMNAAAVDAEGDYMPNSQGDPIQGWLFVTQYAGPNTAINAFEVWGEITLPQGAAGGETPTTPQVRFEVLGNALNDGNFSNLLPPPPE